MKYCQENLMPPYFSSVMYVWYVRYLTVLKIITKKIFPIPSPKWFSPMIISGVVVCCHCFVLSLCGPTFFFFIKWQQAIGFALLYTFNHIFWCVYQNCISINIGGKHCISGAAIGAVCLFTQTFMLELYRMGCPSLII